MNPLEQASADALDAVRISDLEALAHALELRSRAMAAGDLPTAGVHAAGELTAQLLRELIRDTQRESARLRQLGEGFAPAAESGTSVDTLG